MPSPPEQSQKPLAMLPYRQRHRPAARWTRFHWLNCHGYTDSSRILASCFGPSASNLGFVPPSALHMGNKSPCLSLVLSIRYGAMEQWNNGTACGLLVTW